MPDIPLAITESTNGMQNVPSTAVPNDVTSTTANSPKPSAEQPIPAPPVLEQQLPQPTVVSVPLPLNVASAVSSSVSSANVSNLFCRLKSFKWQM